MLKNFVFFSLLFLASHDALCTDRGVSQGLGRSPSQTGERAVRGALNASQGRKKTKASRTAPLTLNTLTLREKLSAKDLAEIDAAISNHMLTVTKNRKKQEAIKAKLVELEKKYNEMSQKVLQMHRPLLPEHMIKIDSTVTELERIEVALVERVDTLNQIKTRKKEEQHTICKERQIMLMSRSTLRGLKKKAAHALSKTKKEVADFKESEKAINFRINRLREHKSLGEQLYIPIHSTLPKGSQKWLTEASGLLQPNDYKELLWSLNKSLDQASVYALEGKERAKQAMQHPLTKLFKCEEAYNAKIKTKADIFNVLKEIKRNIQNSSYKNKNILTDTLVPKCFYLKRLLENTGVKTFNEFKKGPLGANDLDFLVIRVLSDSLLVDPCQKLYVRFLTQSIAKDYLQTLGKKQKNTFKSKFEEAIQHFTPKALTESASEETTPFEFLSFNSPQNPDANVLHPDLLQELSKKQQKTPFRQQLKKIKDNLFSENEY